jgi:hypothetical protein
VATFLFHDGKGNSLSRQRTVPGLVVARIERGFQAAGWFRIEAVIDVFWALMGVDHFGQPTETARPAGFDRSQRVDIGEKKTFELIGLNMREEPFRSTGDISYNGFVKFGLKHCNATVYFRQSPSFDKTREIGVQCI